MTIRVKTNLNIGKKKTPTHRIFNGVSGLFTWSWWPDLNRRPADYESAALPTEPHQHNNNSILDFWHKSRGNGAKVEKIFWVGYFCS
jgi:hypothetical protein